MVNGRAELPPLIAEIVEAAVDVAQAASGSVAVALVGSWASGKARQESDVDLVVLTREPEVLLQDDTWHAAFGAHVTLIRERDFGALQERRLRLASGLEVEVCVGLPSWAATPVDDGTRRVVTDGLRVLWDPESRLAALVAAVGAP